MSSSHRRRMQNAVAVFRDADSGLSQRRPTDLLMLSSAERIVHGWEDLSVDLVIANPRDAASVSRSVTAAIVEAARKGLRSDASGLERIGDPVSKLICHRQVPVIETLHTMAWVLMGVEAGLREVVAGHASKVRAAEECAPAKKLAEGRGAKTRAVSGSADVPLPRSGAPVTSSATSGAALQADASDGQTRPSFNEAPNARTTGTSRVKPDTQNL